MEAIYPGSGPPHPLPCTLHGGMLSLWMFTGIACTLRFGSEWLHRSESILAEEIELDGDDGPIPGTRFRPRGSHRGGAWILLHGITRPGRRHVNLVRFARSVAASGTTVLVPEVADWVSLGLEPARSLGAVESALAVLEADPLVVGKPGLMGFSFGGPQALRVAGDPAVRHRLRCVAAFGGYGSLERTVRFLLTGLHEWEGEEYRVRPDPYGRWIVASNYLTSVPGFEDAQDVAAALRELAAYAGDHRIESWDASLDTLKREIAARVAPERRGLFAFFAPDAAHDPPGPSGEAESWAERLSAAGNRVTPELSLPDEVEVPLPTFLVHGRNDHLIPFSETLRLARRVRAPRLETTITALFAHSAGDPRPKGPVAWTRELWRFSRAMGGILSES